MNLPYIYKELGISYASIDDYQFHFYLLLRYANLINKSIDTSADDKDYMNSMRYMHYIAAVRALLDPDAFSYEVKIFFPIKIAYQRCKSLLCKDDLKRALASNGKENIFRTEVTKYLKKYTNSLPSLNQNAYYIKEEHGL